MRLKNALKNSIFGMSSQVLMIVLGIFLQRVLVQTLAKELIGLNSVFGNVISILSLSEMGVAAAIVYNLYKPISQGDESTICKLMTLFKSAYRVIAACVFSLGIILIPFVHIFIGGDIELSIIAQQISKTPFIGFLSADSDLAFIRLVFLLFVIKTSLSYLLSYKRSLLTACQKAYIISGMDFLARLTEFVLSFFVLISTGSIVCYLCVTIFTTVVENIIISLIADRMYPYLKRREKPDRGTAKKVFSDVGNIFVGKLSATILNSTDYVIISSFTGVVSAALYYNYNLIINSLLQVIQKMLTGIQASVGNLFAEGDTKKDYDVLRKMTFIFFWLSAVCGICIFCLIDDFVTKIWLGAQWQMPVNIVALCVFIFFLLNVRGPLWSMVGVSGLFSHDKYISVVGALSNLAVSLVLVITLDNSSPYMWGVFGVFVGTLVSQSLQLVLKIRLLFKRGLSLSSGRFTLDLIEYFLIFTLGGAGIYFICSLVPVTDAWIGFIIKGIISFSMSNALIALIYFRSNRFRSVIKLTKFFLKKGGGQNNADNSDGNIQPRG